MIMFFRASNYKLNDQRLRKELFINRARLAKDEPITHDRVLLLDLEYLIKNQ